MANFLLFLCLFSLAGCSYSPTEIRGQGLSFSDDSVSVIPDQLKGEIPSWGTDSSGISGLSSNNKSSEEIILEPTDNMVSLLESTLPNVGETGSDGSVIKSRAAMSLGASSVLQAQTLPISIQQSPSTEIQFDTSHFSISKLERKRMDFGTISLIQLDDNQINICGSNKKKQCKKAVIRLYSVSPNNSASGLYNTNSNWGAPLQACRTHDLAWNIVGPGIAQAIILQSVEINPEQHRLKLSDFPDPTYQVQCDLSNAPAGIYQTILVIEYVLLP